MSQTTVAHIGLNVGDVERSSAFYERLGASVLIDTQLQSGPAQDAGLQLEGAVQKLKMLTLGGVVLELIEYVEPAGRPFDRRVNDVGGAHVAFQVAEMDRLVGELRAEGVEFFSDPIDITKGPFAGGAWVYLRDPDGIVVELLQPGEAFLAALDAS